MSFCCRQLRMITKKSCDILKDSSTLSRQFVRFVKDFGEVLLRLEETPTIYGYSRDEVLRQREYRKFLIGRYVALFKIDEPRNTVEIYRIFPRNTKLYEIFIMKKGLLHIVLDESAESPLRIRHIIEQ